MVPLLMDQIKVWTDTHGMSLHITQVLNGPEILHRILVVNGTNIIAEGFGPCCNSATYECALDLQKVSSFVLETPFIGGRTLWLTTSGAILESNDFTYKEEFKPNSVVITSKNKYQILKLARGPFGEYLYTVKGVKP